MSASVRHYAVSRKRYLGTSTDYLVNECEKIELSNHKSTPLPNLQEAKCSLNPCLFSGHIYLCGGESQLLEAFSPHTDTFLPLQIQLPEDTSCCLYTRNSYLVVLSYQYISQFSIGKAGQLVHHAQVEAQTPVNKYSNSQPVLNYIQGFFFIVQENKCLCIDMETGAQVQSYA